MTRVVSSAVLRGIWLCCVVLCAQSVSAQSGGAPAAPLSESLSGQAKADYDAGRILVADDDFAGALVKFQQAFIAAGDVRLLWNMAVCEKNLRHYANVLHLLERYRREGSGQMSTTHRQEVDDVLATVRTLISSVTLDVNESGASVYVDDRLSGTTPLAEPLLVDLGTRRIRVSKPGFVEQSITQDFGGGSSAAFSFVLQAQPRDARLSIATDASGLISVDGKAVGTGYWAGTVLAGEHTLKVTAPDMQPFHRELNLEAGQSRSLQVSLTKEPSAIPTIVWVGAAALVSAGLATGGYFLFRGAPSDRPAYSGTLPPGVVNVDTR